MFTTAADHRHHHRFCTLHNTSRRHPFHSPLPNHKPVHPCKMSAFDNVPGQSDIVRLFPPEMVAHTVELTANRTSVVSDSPHPSDIQQLPVMQKLIPSTCQYNLLETLWPQMLMHKCVIEIFRLLATKKSQLWLVRINYELSLFDWWLILGKKPSSNPLLRYSQLNNYYTNVRADDWWPDLCQPRYMI